MNGRPKITSVEKFSFRQTELSCKGMSTNKNAPKEGHLTGARVGFNFERSVFFKTSSPLSFDKENVNPSATNDKNKEKLSGQAKKSDVDL